jgi:hypothetical protein
MNSPAGFQEFNRLYLAADQAQNTLIYSIQSNRNFIIPGKGVIGGLLFFTPKKYPDFFNILNPPSRFGEFVV